MLGSRALQTQEQGGGVGGGGRTPQSCSCSMMTRAWRPWAVWSTATREQGAVQEEKSTHFASNGLVGSRSVERAPNTPRPPIWLRTLHPWATMRSRRTVRVISSPHPIGTTQRSVYRPENPAPHYPSRYHSLRQRRAPPTGDMKKTMPPDTSNAGSNSNTRTHRNRYRKESTSNPPDDLTPERKSD